MCFNKWIKKKHHNDYMDRTILNRNDDSNIFVFKRNAILSLFVTKSDQYKMKDKQSCFDRHLGNIQLSLLMIYHIPHLA